MRLERAEMNTHQLLEYLVHVPITHNLLLDVSEHELRPEGYLESLCSKSSRGIESKETVLIYMCSMETHENVVDNGTRNTHSKAARRRKRRSWIVKMLVLELELRRNRWMLTAQKQERGGIHRRVRYCRFTENLPVPVGKKEKVTNWWGFWCMGWGKRLIVIGPQKSETPTDLIYF